MVKKKGDSPAPTAAERVSKWVDDLVARGGRRFNLKLSPEGNAALALILEKAGYKDDTTAINQTLIKRAQELENKRDQKGEEQK